MCVNIVLDVKIFLLLETSEQTFKVTLQKTVTVCRPDFTQNLANPVFLISPYTSQKAFDFLFSFNLFVFFSIVTLAGGKAEILTNDVFSLNKIHVAESLYKLKNISACSTREALEIVTSHRKTLITAMNGAIHTTFKIKAVHICKNTLKADTRFDFLAC